MQRAHIASSINLREKPNFLSCFFTTNKFWFEQLFSVLVFLLNRILSFLEKEKNQRKNKVELTRCSSRRPVDVTDILVFWTPSFLGFCQYIFCLNHPKSLTLYMNKFKEKQSLRFEVIYKC